MDIFGLILPIGIWIFDGQLKGGFISVEEAALNFS